MPFLISSTRPAPSHSVTPSSYPRRPGPQDCSPPQMFTCKYSPSSIQQIFRKLVSTRMGLRPGTRMSGRKLSSVRPICDNIFTSLFKNGEKRDKVVSFSSSTLYPFFLKKTVISLRTKMSFLLIKMTENDSSCCLPFFFLSFFLLCSLILLSF